MASRLELAVPGSPWAGDLVDLNEFVQHVVKEPQSRGQLPPFPAREGAEGQGRKALHLPGALGALPAVPLPEQELCASGTGAGGISQSQGKLPPAAPSIPAQL